MSDIYIALHDQECDMTEGEIGEVIEMAWADDVSFEAIERVTGLSEPQVIALMRAQLRPSSFRLWRKRVSGRASKHARRPGSRT